VVGREGDTGSARRRGKDVRDRILDVAERLVQQRGFNGFSYADVAAELGLSKAALHYHFAGKAELGEALIDRYARGFAAELARVEAGGGDARARLAAYAGLYGRLLEEDRMCLCGVLAAEYRTLPEGMRRALRAFFDANQTWLARVLEGGRAAGALSFPGSSAATAQLIVAGLEGAMLVARPYGDAERFRVAAERLLEGLTAGAPVR